MARCFMQFIACLAALFVSAVADIDFSEEDFLSAIDDENDQLSKESIALSLLQANRAKIYRAQAAAQVAEAKTPTVTDAIQEAIMIDDLETTVGVAFIQTEATLTHGSKLKQGMTEMVVAGDGSLEIGHQHSHAKTGVRGGKMQVTFGADGQMSM